jgi:hypothetical protein
MPQMRGYHKDAASTKVKAIMKMEGRGKNVAKGAGLHLC